VEVAEEASVAEPVEPAKFVADQPIPYIQADGRPDTDLPPTYDAWEVDQRLQHIERVLKGAAAASLDPALERSLDRPKRSRKGARTTRIRIDGAHGRSRPAKRSSEPVRLDASHPGVPGWHVHAKPRRRKRARHAPQAAPASRVGPVVWLTLSLGVMMFVCGGLLLGWSIVAARKELWSVGLPIALAGQVALLVGLLLQLERMWRHSHVTKAQLDNVGEQLHDLKSTTALLGTTHSTPAVAFYSHMAGGASPQILLTDLKGQLDLLAVKIGQMEE
jgi:hypothetical protein